MVTNLFFSDPVKSNHCVSTSGRILIVVEPSGWSSLGRSNLTDFSQTLALSTYRIPKQISLAMSVPYIILGKLKLGGYFKITSILTRTLGGIGKKSPVSSAICCSNRQRQVFTPRWLSKLGMGGLPSKTKENSGNSIVSDIVAVVAAAAVAVVVVYDDDFGEKEEELVFFF